MDIKILASGSSGNCYHISDGETSILLDAGIPIRQIRIGCDFQLSKVSGCLVTHYHGDHSKAVPDLLYHGIAIYITRAEAEKIPLVFAGKPIHFLRRNDESEDSTYANFKVGTFQVLPFPVEHDTPEPVGYLLRSTVTGEKLLYFTDSYYVRYRFTGLTHIIGECNYDSESLWEHLETGKTPSARAKRLFTSHMSLENFLDLLKATDLSRLRQIYICHMSNDHGDEAKIKAAVQRLTGAEVYVC